LSQSLRLFGTMPLRSPSSMVGVNQVPIRWMKETSDNKGRVEKPGKLPGAGDALKSNVSSTSSSKGSGSGSGSSGSGSGSGSGKPKEKDTGKPSTTQPEQGADKKSSKDNSELKQSMKEHGGSDGARKSRNEEIKGQATNANQLGKDWDKYNASKGGGRSDPDGKSDKK